MRPRVAAVPVPVAQVVRHFVLALAWPRSQSVQIQHKPVLSELGFPGGAPSGTRSAHCGNPLNLLEANSRGISLCSRPPQTVSNLICLRVFRIKPTCVGLILAIWDLSTHIACCPVLGGPCLGQRGREMDGEKPTRLFPA